MKKRNLLNIALLLCLAITIMLGACKKDKYDDTDLKNKIEEQQKKADDDGTGSAPETENVYDRMKDQIFINYCKARGFDGGNGILSPKEAAAVTYISVTYRHITSLEGIEYFTGLNGWNVKTTTLLFLI